MILASMDVWWLFVLIGLIGFAAGMIHSAIGFGFGIVAISLFPLVIDARISHVVVSISSVPMLMMAAWAYREGVQWKPLRVSLLGAAICLPFGLALFEIASLDWLVRGTGLAILAMVLWNMNNQRGLSQRRRIWRRQRDVDPPTHQQGGEAGETGTAGETRQSGETRKRGETTEGSATEARGQTEGAGAVACFIAGAAAGFLGGAVSIAGPPVAAFALRQPWSQAAFKSFVTQCLLLIAVYKAALLIWRGWFVGDVVTYTLVASVISILGVQAGALVSARVPAAGFKRLVAFALILVSLQMMWRGQPPAEPQDDSERVDTHQAFRFGTLSESGTTLGSGTILESGMSLSLRLNPSTVDCLVDWGSR